MRSSRGALPCAPADGERDETARRAALQSAVAALHVTAAVLPLASRDTVLISILSHLARAAGHKQQWLDDMLEEASMRSGRARTNVLASTAAYCATEVAAAGGSAFEAAIQEALAVHQGPAR